MSDQTPLDVEAIRARLDAATFTADIIFDNRGGDGEFFKHAPTDLRRLLDENARLNAELAARRNLGVEYERLRVENIQLRDQLAAVRKIKPQRRNSAMVTSEQLATMRGWNDAVDEIRAALNPCECGMTDPSTWETYGGATEPGSMYEWNPGCPAHGAESIEETAQPGAGDADTPGTDSGRGTGVAEPHGAQADLSLIPSGLIKTNPGIRGGEPCITGTRIPAHEVAGYLADGATWDEIREMLPSLPSLPVPREEA